MRDAVPILINRLVKGRDASRDKFFWSLKDVSFRVKKGETMGIIGQNSAGKTTILKLLAGIMAQSRGTIIKRGRMSCLIIAEAGFHPQFTGRENIYLNGAMLGLRRREIREKFDSIVEFASYGLPDFKKFIDTPVIRYSYGMLVRLGFAVAAHVNFNILLVDEILAVGDISFQHRCYEYMNELKESDTTVIMVSHNMAHIANYCDRVILLNEGQIMAQGDPQEVISKFESSLQKEKSLYFAGAVSAIRTKGGAFLSNMHFDNAERAGNTLHVNYGDAIKASFDYECVYCKPENITFSLSVYRKIEGYKCFCISSNRYNYFTNKNKGHVDLFIKEHNLLPGEYVFDIEIRSLPDNEALDAHRERDVYVKSDDKTFNYKLYGIYQPSGVSWKII